MAVTGTKNVSTIATTALRRASRTPWGQAPEAEDMAEAISELFSMLKAWQVDGAMWTRDSQSVSLVTDQANYTLTSPARPLRIHNARYKDANGYEMPMQRLVRDDYDLLPNKSAKGVPTCFYYDRAREQGTLYVWPVPASATTETVEMTIEAEIDDVTSSSQALDVPAEWYDAVIYNLAARLSFQMDARLEARAAECLAVARAFANAESLYLSEAE